MTHAWYLSPASIFSCALAAVGLMFRSEGLLVLALVGLMLAYYWGRR